VRSSLSALAPLPAYGAAQRRKAALAGGDGAGADHLPSSSRSALHDVWAPERAAGAASGAAVAGFGEGFMGASVGQYGGVGGGAGASRSSIPGMKVMTIAGGTLDPLEAPEAMDLDGGIASAAADSASRAAAAAAAKADKLEERPATKLARRKQKKLDFVAKLTGLRDAKAKHADVAKRRANPPVLVGDVTGLQAELEGIARDAAARPQKVAKVPAPAGMTPKAARALKAEVDAKVKLTMSKKGRRAALATETAAFRATLAHPQFRARPAATIAEHLKNAMLAERSAIEGLAAAGECARTSLLCLADTHASSWACMPV
jgi:hypothetical protein